MSDNKLNVYATVWNVARDSASVKFTDQFGKTWYQDIVFHDGGFNVTITDKDGRIFVIASSNDKTVKDDAAKANTGPDGLPLPKRRGSSLTWIDSNTSNEDTTFTDEEVKVLKTVVKNMMMLREDDLKTRLSRAYKAYEKGMISIEEYMTRVKSAIQ